MKIKTAEEFAASIAHCDNTTRIKAFEEAMGQAVLVIKQRVEALKRELGGAGDFAYRLRLDECEQLLRALTTELHERKVFVLSVSRIDARKYPGTHIIEYRQIAGVTEGTLILLPGFTGVPEWRKILSYAETHGFEIREEK